MLNHLHIDINDVWFPGNRQAWSAILLEIIQSVGGAQHLAIQHWELLAKLVTEGFVKKPTHNPDVTISLIGADERDKLECWMSVVWMVWRPQPGNAGKELEDAMDLLGKERRGTVGKRIE